MEYCAGVELFSDAKEATSHLFSQDIQCYHSWKLEYPGKPTVLARVKVDNILTDFSPQM